MTDVRAASTLLRDYAEHFVQSDWEVTRKHDIKHIRFKGDWSGYDAIHRRIGRALQAVFRPHTLQRLMKGLMTLRGRLLMAQAELSTEAHLPDSVLDGGNIIVFWEETAEYIQLVQPSVGSLIADFLDAEPHNEHAIRIAAEIQRIQHNYADRLNTEALDDD